VHELEKAAKAHMKEKQKPTLEQQLHRYGVAWPVKKPHG
jgi:hypothetical protein